MALWALTNRWCFIGATPSINPSVLLLQLWKYGLLQINGALLEQRQLLILVSFLNYVIMIIELWTLTYRWCLIGATPSKNFLDIPPMHTHYKKFYPPP